MAQNMQYIWDEEFDNEAPLVDEVPPEVAAVAVPQQQLVAAVEQVPNAEVKNNRNGAQNWSVLENTSLMTLIDKGKKYNIGRTSPLWDEVAREFSLPSYQPMQDKIQPVVKIVLNSISYTLSSV